MKQKSLQERLWQYNLIVLSLDIVSEQGKSAEILSHE